MYGIKMGVEVRVLAPGQEWTEANLRPHRIREFRVFDREELVADPTGVSSWCAGPRTDGFLGALAREGYLAFTDAQNGWSLVVHARDAEYDGVPLQWSEGNLRHPAVRQPPVTVDRREVGETNGLVDGPAYHATFDHARRVPWTERGLKITRLRLLSDRGFPAWDVSYCHGYIGKEPVQVDLPFHQLAKGNIVGDIIAYARADKVYAKQLGIISAISKLC